MEITQSPMLSLNNTSLLKLNSIIENLTHSDTLIITNETHSDFLKIAQTVPFTFVPAFSHKAIRLPPQETLTAEGKANVIKLTLLALNDFTINNNLALFDYALSIIHQLFKQHFFIENDIRFFFCFIIQLTSDKLEEDDQAAFAFKFISNVFNEMELNEESKAMIKDIADFLIKLKTNDELIAAKLNRLNLFHLFQFDRDDLNCLMTPFRRLILDISLFHYDSFLFNTLLSSLIDQLGRDTVSGVPSNIIVFVKDMIERELDMKAKDDFFFFDRLYFHKEQLKGVSLSGVPFPSSPYTLIFSVKLSPDCNAKCIPLITINSIENTSSKPFLIYLNATKHVCIELNDIITTDISISPNKSYVILISQNGRLFNIQVNNIKTEFSNSRISHFKAEKCLMTIGSSSYNKLNDKSSKAAMGYFSGYFGSVILYKSYFTNEMIQALVKLKGQYDSVLLCNQKQKHSNSAIGLNSKALDFFLLKKQHEHLVAFLSPQHLNSHKLNSQRNILHSTDNLIKLSTNGLKCFIDRQVYLSSLDLTLNEFLRLEGIRFIQLNIEYYQQLLENIKVIKNNEILVTISNEISRIFSLIKLLLELADCSYFTNKSSPFDSMFAFIDLPLKDIKHNSNEIIFLFSSYTNVLLTIALISPRHIAPLLKELLSFISVCAFQEDTNELFFTLKTKLIYFLFNKTLYERGNKAQLSHFVTTIDECICKNPKGLFNKDFLMAMLTFTDDIIEGYGGMLRTYLEMSYAQSKELFLCFFYIIANEDKDMNLLVKMLLTSFAFCFSLPPDERKPLLASISFDKLIINKLNDLKATSTPSEAKAIAIAVLIQLIRFVQMDNNDIDCLLKGIEMNEIAFRSVIFSLYQSISTQEFLIVISNNDEFKALIIKGDKRLIELNVEFWFETVIKCYLRIEDNDVKAIAYDNVFGLLENQVRLLDSKEKLGRLYRILHSKSVFAKFFYKSRLDDVTSSDLIRISKEIMTKHPKPFVFSLLFKFYVQNEVKAIIGTTRRRHQTLSSKNDPKAIQSYLAQNEPVTIEIDTQDTSNDSIFYLNTNKDNKDLTPHSWETQVDHLGLIVNSLLQYTISQLKSLKEAQEDTTQETKKHLLINNINLYIFLYKVFCLQRSLVENKKKLNFFKAIESDLIINTHNFYCYSLPFLRIIFPIEKQGKLVLEILFELYNEFLLLTENKKYFEHFISYLTFDLARPSFLYEADALFMLNKQPSDLNIDKSLFLQLESKMAEIPKLKREELSLTLFYLIKFSIVLLKEETVNYKVYSEFKVFLPKFLTGLFNEVKQLLVAVKKSKPLKTDYSDKYYVKIKKEIAQNKKWTMTDFDSLLSKLRLKEKEEIDKVFNKLLFNKTGHIIQEERLIKQRKSFMFGRTSIDLIPRKLSGEEDIYGNVFIDNESSLNEVKAKDVYAKLLKEQKFDLDYQGDYFLFNFPMSNLKKRIVHIVFGYYFRKVLFHDEGFCQLKKEFKATFSGQLLESDGYGYLPYPTKLKNYFINYTKPFLKPAMSYLNKNPQLVGVAYRGLHYQSSSQKKLRFFINQLNRVKLPNKIATYWGELISIEGTSFGLISLSNNYLQFQAKSQMDPRLTNCQTPQEKLNFVLSSLESDILIQKKAVLFRYSDIKVLFKKRYIYAMIASEFFLSTGKSYLFNLFTEERNTAFLTSINTIANRQLLNPSQSIIDRFLSNDYPSKWLRKEISTFDYLLLINNTSRSFNDGNQYPVFPYMEIMDMKSSIVKRDFEYPVSVQDEKKRKQIIRQKESMEVSFRNHFNTHFSTSSFVIYYLIRINPFAYNMIKLQNGTFDLPGRIFHSYEELLSILQQLNDNRELVPEVFYFPEMFINLNFFNLGTRQHDDVQLHNVLLLDREKKTNPVAFVIKYRKMLEANEIVSNIHKWIDNVFGVNQLTTAKGSCNLFMKYCYEEKVNLSEKMNQMQKKSVPPNEIWNKIRNKIALILNFGQTPLRVFKDKHPVFSEEKGNPIHIGDRTMCSISTKSDSSFSVLSIAKEILCFKEIAFGGKPKGIFFISKDKEVYNNLVSFDQSLLKPKRFPLEYAKYNDLGNAKVKKHFYIGRNVFELFYTTFSEASVFCGYYDKSITFSFERLSESFSYTMESVVTSIEKITESKFATGHLNGKVIIWEFDYSQFTKEMNLKQLKSFLQNSRIIRLVYCSSLNLLFIADEEGEVCIRDLVTLELLTVISPRGDSPRRSLLVTHIAINKYNYIYISAFDKLSKDFWLFGFTLNGVLFSKTRMLSQDFQLLPNDTILIFAKSPENKPRFLSVDPTNLTSIIYSNNSPSVNQISHFILCLEKKFIYITDYRYDKLQIAVLSDEDIHNYCYRPMPN